MNDIDARLAISSLFGSLISFRFLAMNWKARITAAVSAIIMAYLLGPAFTAWLEVQPEFVGCLMGLFGMAICDCIYKGLQNSDLSFRIGDIIRMFKGGE